MFFNKNKHKGRKKGAYSLLKELLEFVVKICSESDIEIDEK